MEYREFRGKKISALGFGCMRLPTTDGVPLSKNIDEGKTAQMLHEAIENGVNYIDTAYYYHNSMSEEAVGRALAGGWREKVFLATKSPIYALEDAEDFDRKFEDQLRRLQTDHIDFYLLHCITRPTWESKVLKFGLIEKMRRLKEQGRVSYIGFSFHDDYELFEEIIGAFEGCDFCQIQLNYVGEEYQAGIKGLEYAHSKGIPVVIMEPLLGGKLAVPSPQVARELDPAKTPVEWALDYLWNRPEVFTVLSGMGEIGQVRENLEYAGRSHVGMLGREDLAMLARASEVFAKMALVPCTKCAYCMPCPAGLNIPELYEAYNRTATRGDQEAKKYYESLAVKADSCVACGKCEKACPQSIAGGEMMKKLVEAFGRIKLE